MHAMFDRAAEQDKENKKLPLEYAAGSIGNAARGPVAMLTRGAWGYDDETGKILAAAPELLAAVEYALCVARVEKQQLLEDGHQPDGMTIGGINAEIEKYESAIAKARGGGELDKSWLTRSDNF